MCVPPPPLLVFLCAASGFDPPPRWHTARDLVCPCLHRAPVSTRAHSPLFATPRTTFRVCVLGSPTWHLGMVWIARWKTWSPPACIGWPCPCWTQSQTWRRCPTWSRRMWHPTAAGTASPSISCCSSMCQSCARHWSPCPLTQSPGGNWIPRMASANALSLSPPPFSGSTAPPLYRSPPPPRLPIPPTPLFLRSPFQLPASLLAFFRLPVPCFLTFRPLDTHRRRCVECGLGVSLLGAAQCLWDLQGYPRKPSPPPSTPRQATQAPSHPLDCCV